MKIEGKEVGPYPFVFEDLSLQFRMSVTLPVRRVLLKTHSENWRQLPLPGISPAVCGVILNV
jgi:hypothetical protein